MDQAELRMKALGHANRVRVHRAQAKAALKSGELPLRDFLSDLPDWAKGMQIATLLRSLPRWGPARAEKLCDFILIRPNKVLGKLTARQRENLIYEVENASKR